MGLQASALPGSHCLDLDHHCYTCLAPEAPAATTAGTAQVSRAPHALHACSIFAGQAEACRACRACGRTCISISCIRLLRRCACCGAACLPPARGAAAAGTTVVCGLRPGLKVALHQAKNSAGGHHCYWSLGVCVTQSNAVEGNRKPPRGCHPIHTLPDACLPALPAHPPGDGPRVQVALNLVRPLREAGREGDMNAPLPTACTRG